MHMVFWMENAQATSKQFSTSEMREALGFMEGLRKRQHAGESIRFITMASEIDGNLTLPGVAEPSPGYNWRKRRA
jgi:hypothetical protein